MKPKLGELLDKIKSPTRGILGSVIEEQKHEEQDETVLELLREQHLDEKLPKTD